MVGFRPKGSHLFSCIKSFIFVSDVKGLVASPPLCPGCPGYYPGLSGQRGRCPGFGVGVRFKGRILFFLSENYFLRVVEFGLDPFHYPKARAARGITPGCPGFGVGCPGFGVSISKFPSKPELGEKVPQRWKKDFGRRENSVYGKFGGRTQDFRVGQNSFDW